MRKILKEYYAYIYIYTVEQNVDETLKLEDRQMQTLMNKKYILYEIDNVLKTKYEIEGKNRSFLNFTNDYLNEFIKKYQ
ncbi:hypothetical protein BsIDN1_68930 [Bacillus safensis]|uniref:Uncharacterized protein n=1 Tax=Bacillus safensis TaxID=561879 RepID=A0A5S9MKH3_BACIA|nr:hypothetical protein BsIDN1_68930 [Bacillus safensis]